MGAGAFGSRVHTIFFHPDCTVGFGIAPNHTLRLVGYTTGGEFHSALKILFDCRQYTPLRGVCQAPRAKNAPGPKKGL